MPVSPVKAIEGEPFRFYVASESKTGFTYLVDLQANDYNGWCNCEDFEMRRSKNWRLYGSCDQAKCKHVRLARDFLLEQLMRQIARSVAQPEEKI